MRQPDAAGGSGGRQGSGGGPRGLTLYYLATPLFVAVDLALGAPIRVAGLGAPEWRYGYYAVIFGLGVLCHLRPRLAPLVGMAESSVNLLLLLLSVLLPIWDLPLQAAAGGSAELGFDAARVWNVAIVGAALVISFKRSERALHRSSGFGSSRGSH